MVYKYNINKLTYERITLRKYKVLIGLLLIILSVLAFKSPINRFYEDKIVIVIDEDKFTSENLMKEIVLLNMAHPDIVYAQAILESNNGKSKIFRESNNLFGMKLAKNRPTTAIDEQFGHAYYTTWKASVLDYALYQSAYLRGLNKDSYFKYLSQNYAEDVEYVNKLKVIINKTK